MKKVFLKSISVFLCIVCILGAVPLCASAAEVYAPVVSKDYEGLNYVDLTWNDTYPVDNYNVYLSSDGYNFSYYKSVFSNYTSIMDLPKGRYFAYVTSKTSSAGEYGEQESAPSNVVIQIMMKIRVISMFPGAVIIIKAKVQINIQTVIWFL